MKNKKIFLLILVIFFSIFTVRAENCDVNDQVDLANEAAKIKIKRTVESEPDLDTACEEGEGEVCGVTQDYFVVNILNLTENIYIEMTNDKNDEVKKITYADVVDGIASFEWKNVDEITQLTFKVYASTSSACSDKYLMTTYYTLPRKNPYYNISECEGNEDLEVCEEFVDYDEIEYDEFEEILNKAVEKNTKSKNQSFWSKLANFLLKYVILIIIGIGAIVGVVYIVIKRKRSGKNEK